MENRNKKDLAKIALAAFMLSASLPAAGNAAIDAGINGTILAGGGCGAASSNRPASGSCGAQTTRYSPSSSGCGASSSTNAPATHGCGGSSSEGTTTTPPAPPAQQKPLNGQKPVAMADRPNDGLNRPRDSMGTMDNSGASSYQGTTTGPGPNDGYPGTPSGTYQTNPKPVNR